MSYGYKDSSEVAPGAQGGKFGLNTGAHVTKFEYNANGGASGAAQDVIDFTVQVGEREYRHRFFPVSKVFKNNQELTDTNSEEYKAEFQKQMDLFNSTISDIVKVFVPEEDLKAALSAPISSFKDFAQIVTRLVQTSPSWDKKAVDVFLQYQNSPTGDNDRAYLNLPKNVQHGSYIVASLGAGYKEVKTDTSLTYVNEAGEAHPFKRGKWFLESPFTNQVILTGAGAMNESTPTSGTGGGW